MTLCAGLSESERLEIMEHAVSVLSADGDPGYVITCEHASRRVPAQWHDLGLTPAQLQDHIGWDIGAADLTRALVKRLPAMAFLCGYSRLFVECNRMPDATDFAAPVSGGIAVPGNQGLTDDEIRCRKALVYEPFHQKISQALDGILAKGLKPAILSVHSFTPYLLGEERPWHIGILWKGEDRLATRMKRALAARYPGPIGFNQPYDARKYQTMVLDRYALPHGLPHAVFEVRHDLLRTPAQIERWADILADCLKAIEIDGHLGHS